MDKTSAARAFSALAQETRLDVFRMLVRAGSDGMAAGDIARAAGVPHNTMSAHLSVLANAGLVGARRAQLVSAGPDRCYQTDDDLHSVEFTLHIDDQGEANDEQAH